MSFHKKETEKIELVARPGSSGRSVRDVTLLVDHVNGCVNNVMEIKLFFRLASLKSQWSRVSVQHGNADCHNRSQFVCTITKYIWM